MIGCDVDSYEYYYANGIKEIINRMKNKYSGVIVNSKAKELIWQEYCRFNRHCKAEYMSYADHLLDRHKVVACYIYAIEKAYVLYSKDSLVSGDLTNLYMNEEMAFQFGMSLLRAMILDIADSVLLKEDIECVFKGDIDLPECTHGDFKNNFLAQLYYTRKESNYNILALAESLYLIECYNLVKNGLPTNALKIAI